MDNNKIKEIVSNIENAFINEDNYELKKVVEDLHDGDNNFLGDFVSFLMVDKNSNPPTFYFVASPYDLISKKDPQHALVWQGGDLLLNTDYTDFAAMRTGAMDSIALKLCSINSLAKKRVLLFGTGRTAKWSLKILKVIFDDLAEVNYINSTNNRSEEFETFCNEIGINALVGSKDDLKNYDIILCHTNAREPVLQVEDLDKIKKGTIITTFIGSTEHGEVADEFYNEEANIVLDWEKNLKVAKDILRSKTPESSILLLRELLTDEKSLFKDRKYTVFRFVGTPMQNLGVLQALAS
jgi:ornithine cyclodeaminase/alanine dehydrogenase-like protein (mu-crystallin family)